MIPQNAIILLLNTPKQELESEVCVATTKNTALVALIAEIRLIDNATKVASPMLLLVTGNTTLMMLATKTTALD